MKKWIPQVVRQKIRRATIRISPVFWANLGPISHLIAHSIHTLSPPVLVLSIPRSGSSWVGNTLGISSTSLYLREPITQPYIAYKGFSGPSFFEVASDNLPPTYKSSAEASFVGLPAFFWPIVKHPMQWMLFKRPYRRIVIKEINPLAIKWLVDSYSPRIVYLIRHPAAVANSFSQVGWTTGKQFESRFSPESLASSNFNHKQFAHSFWAEHGALQAIILKLSLKVLEGYRECRIVKYEDLCRNPIEGYRELYTFAGLEWDKKVEKQIISQSSLSHNRADSFNIYRHSQTMIDNWKREVPQEAIREIKAAYLFYDPPYYRSEEW